ncbi:hypothetical protein ACFQJ7_00080 [Halovenus rubra]|uniref:Uncharacterized protein n=2 Tax=Halovenus rubra TaxID=869890 RepID=A0ABD5X661_9EURY|nr:hypothetical protein [Halovenus rubra]
MTASVSDGFDTVLEPTDTLEDLRAQFIVLVAVFAYLSHLAGCTYLNIWC